MLVTPLILTRFDETEIAAWYLFASLNFFGTILSQRLGLTFSRMFAFAMGGASDLAPIKGVRPVENGGKPNWKSFEKAYGTIGAVNLSIGWLNVIIALGMGWFGLNNILQGYEAAGTIWLAFAIMQASSLLVFIFKHWVYALLGMNYVALTNRWEIIFGIASCLAGSLTLFFGGGIVALTLAMQAFAVAGILRSRFLLARVENGRVCRFKSLAFDKTVFRWAWPPTWKGFVGEFGQLGALQLTAIIYTGFAPKGDVAAYLFALRMMQTARQLAQAPFSSVQPLMSRLRAAGEIAKLKNLVYRRVGITLSLMALAVLAGGAVLPLILQWMGASLEFIPVPAWYLLGGLTLVSQFNLLCCSVSAIGNEMIYYWHSAIAAILGAAALFYFQDALGVYTPILAAILPAIILMNVGPLRKAIGIIR